MVAETEIVITHSVGLHARPSVKFTKLAKSFDCKIQIAANDSEKWIDAKSIVKVMGLKAPEGTRLQIRAEGTTAEGAVGALRALVERDFDEAHKHKDADNAKSA